MVGDYLKANKESSAAVDRAVTVIKWFTHHSYALGIFNQEQLTSSTSVLAFIIPIITRWTAHYCAVARLLLLEKSVQVTVIKHEESLIDSVGKKKETREKAQQVMETVKSRDFWTNLKT